MPQAFFKAEITSRKLHVPLWDHAIHMNFHVQTLWENLFLWMNLVSSFIWRFWVSCPQGTTAHVHPDSPLGDWIIYFLQTTIQVWFQRELSSGIMPRECFGQECTKFSCAHPAPVTLLQQCLCPSKHSHELSCQAPACATHPQLKFKNLMVVCHPGHRLEIKKNHPNPNHTTNLATPSKPHEETQGTHVLIMHHCT